MVEQFPSHENPMQRRDFMTKSGAAIIIGSRCRLPGASGGRQGRTGRAPRETAPMPWRSMARTMPPAAETP